jgi:hypothetical protein
MYNESINNIDLFIKGINDILVNNVNNENIDYVLTQINNEENKEFGKVPKYL